MEAATAGLMALDQALAATLFSSAPGPPPRWQVGVAGQQGGTKPSLFGVAELQQQVSSRADHVCGGDCWCFRGCRSAS